MDVTGPLINRYVYIKFILILLLCQLAFTPAGIFAINKKIVYGSEFIHENIYSQEQGIL